jgi:cell division protein FtsL
MRVFSAAATVLFSLIMVYGLQHFYAIENSYRIESEKQVRDQLREENRQLRLSEAQLSQPGRLDGMARQLGLAEPQPGQVVHAAPRIENSAPVLAQINTPPQNPIY